MHIDRIGTVCKDALERNALLIVIDDVEPKEDLPLVERTIERRRVLGHKPNFKSVPEARRTRTKALLKAGSERITPPPEAKRSISISPASNDVSRMVCPGNICGRAKQLKLSAANPRALRSENTVDNCCQLSKVPTAKRKMDLSVKLMPITMGCKIDLHYRLQSLPAI
jgi:hypothetical protein